MVPRFFVWLSINVGSLGQEKPQQLHLTQKTSSTVASSASDTKPGECCSGRRGEGSEGTEAGMDGWIFFDPV